MSSHECPVCGLTAHRGMRFETFLAAVFNGTFAAVEILSLARWAK